jgi:hypothetical protein
VSVVDPDEIPVTDFEEIRVERRLTGADSWGSILLTHQGDGIFVGEYVFETSGSYELRVAGLRPSDNEIKVMLEIEDSLEVVRAHSAAGGYRVDFEAMPGHIHAGDSSTLNFWVDLETVAAPASGTVSGLSPTILVGANGSEGTFAAAETEPGRYTAAPTFNTIGVVPVTFRYMGLDAVQHDYTVNLFVHAPH